MKKLKLLLLALAVIALIVAGITVTVSADAVADTTILTVNGEEYSAVPESIPDGAVVLGYKPCENVPYNPNATYKLANEKPDAGVERISSLIINKATGLVHFGGSNPHSTHASSNMNVTAEMVACENQGDVIVTIYSIVGNLPYNQNASYVIAGKSFNQCHLKVSRGLMDVNSNSSLPGVSAGDVVIGLGGTYYKQNTWSSLATYVVGEYANVTLADPSCCTTTSVALDTTDAEKRIGFFSSPLFENLEQEIR